MGIIKFNNVPSTTPGLEVETFPNYVAPEKEYQVTHVPGRNGDLVVDTKTYKNVPRSYKVSMAVEPPAVSVSGSTASFEATAERALAECKTVISSDVGKVGTTIINSATDLVENNEPYNFRAVSNGVGDRENDTLIGGTVAFNQLANFERDQIPSSASGITYAYTDGTSVKINGQSNSNAPRSGWFGLSERYLTSNCVYLIEVDKLSGGIDGNISMSFARISSLQFGVARIDKITQTGTDLRFYYIIPNGTTCTDLIITINCFNLTQMFGSTIADYIYGLETATAGAGVAWFRNLFPKDYYAYNAGELISVKTEAHKTTGKNLYNTNNQTKTSINTYCPMYLPANSDITFSTNIVQTGLYAHYYDNGNWVEIARIYNSRILTFNTGNHNYIRLITYNEGTQATEFQAEFGSTATTYEPYEEHIYPLNPALELRGIPKLNSSNKLYYDGDIYSSDGSVIRKYGIVDLGTLDWSKMTFQNNNWRFSCSLPSDFRQPTTAAEHANFVCSKYSYSNSPINGTTGFGASLYVNNSGFYVMDMNYSDATAFKTAMSGVYLIYELATPVIESTSGLIDNVSIASFDNGAYNEPVNSLVVDITAIESGNGEKSPDNSYTISGFDKGIVTRCGKNLNTQSFEIGSLQENSSLGTAYRWCKLTSTTRIRTADVVNVKRQTVTISVAQGYSFFILAFDEKGLYTSRYYSWNSQPLIITDFAQLGIAIKRNDEAVVTDSDFVNCNLQIEIGNQATTYEAYNGNTYTFAFGQTVYGGHFDNKGNLVVTHGVNTLNAMDFNTLSSPENHIFRSNYVQYLTGIKCPLTNNYQDIIGSISEKASEMDYTRISANDNNKYAFSIENTNRFVMIDMACSTVEDFMTAHGNDKIVYPLATPITLSITSQDIPTLLGVNNIFSNTGNIKSLSYPKQVCPFEPAQEVDDHGTEEYVDNREVAIPVGHESKYFTAGKIYNFSWLDEAGLIKEGELNADTGVLTITNGYGIVDLGSLSWTRYNASGNYIFYADILDGRQYATTGISVSASCDCYRVYAQSIGGTAVGSGADKMLGMNSSNQYTYTRILVKDDSYTDATTFKSAMHGVKLLYELADPVRTIQLTPVQVESLIGHNVLISESGNISVTPRTYSTYTEKMNAISDWLHSASGYARLEDTYEPDYYRKAYYNEQTDIENIFNEAGQATLNFICKPQRYLKSGEEPITISSGGLIQNRTRYEAYPILKVTTNNTQGSVAIGNHSITIKAGAGTDPITIDCELQDAWSGTTNKNSFIVLTDGEFPVIDPGIQTVTFDGGVQSVEVIPRWWTV